MDGHPRSSPPLVLSTAGAMTADRSLVVETGVAAWLQDVPYQFSAGGTAAPEAAEVPNPSGPDPDRT